VKVKNKAPAEVQITAEQLLREAKERELELLPPPPKQKITDEEELNDYKLKKRKVRPQVTHELHFRLQSYCWYSVGCANQTFSTFSVVCKSCVEHSSKYIDLIRYKLDLTPSLRDLKTTSERTVLLSATG
jgi:murein endopeptidase